MARTQSECWFDRYVSEHGHNPGRPEPSLCGPTRPDRLISWNGNEVLCEIKEFSKDRITTRVGSYSFQGLASSVRNAIKGAAAQLKPYARTGRPLVIVLANPHKVLVPLSPRDVFHALFGDPTVQVCLDPETQESDEVFVAGRNGVLTRDHAYVSGVAVLRHRTYEADWIRQVEIEQRVESPQERLALVEEQRTQGRIPKGGYLFMETFLNYSDEAEPLPRNVFDGQRDLRWEPEPAPDSPDRLQWREVTGHGE